MQSPKQGEHRNARSPKSYTPKAFDNMKKASDLGGALIRLGVFGAIILFLLRSYMPGPQQTTEQIIRLTGLFVIVFPVWAWIFFSTLTYIIYAVLEPVFGYPLNEAKGRLARKFRSKFVPVLITNFIATVVAEGTKYGIGLLLLALCLNVSSQLLTLIDKL